MNISRQQAYEILKNAEVAFKSEPIASNGFRGVGYVFASKKEARKGLKALGLGIDSLGKHYRCLSQQRSTEWVIQYF